MTVVLSATGSLAGISFKDEFCAIAGFTQGELEVSFSPRIGRIAAGLGKGRACR
jgi:hypothetical protein